LRATGGKQEEHHENDASENELDIHTIDFTGTYLRLMRITGS